MINISFRAAISSCNHNRIKMLITLPSQVEANERQSERKCALPRKYVQLFQIGLTKNKFYEKKV